MKRGGTGDRRSFGTACWEELGRLPGTMMGLWPVRTRTQMSSHSQVSVTTESQVDVLVWAATGDVLMSEGCAGLTPPSPGRGGEPTLPQPAQD